jgi:hypothetical protein
MTVSPAAGLLANNIFGVALLLHEDCAFTQIPPPPLQHVLTTHRESDPQSASVLHAGLEHGVLPGTQSPPPPFREPQIQPEPQPMYLLQEEPAHVGFVHRPLEQPPLAHWKDVS